MNVSSNAVPKDAGNTIYWKNTTEARVTAWTPNIFDPNVDISDQSSGMSVSISCTPPPWGVMTRPSTSVSTTGW